VRLRADRALELLEGGLTGRGSRVRAEPDGTWTGLGGYCAGETLCAVRGPDGTVTCLDVGSFVLTRGPYSPDAVVPGGADPTGWRTA
jgi:D-alanyl-D-alanine carboxypeptidase